MWPGAPFARQRKPSNKQEPTLGSESSLVVTTQSLLTHKIKAPVLPIRLTMICGVWMTEAHTNSQESTWRKAEPEGPGRFSLVARLSISMSQRDDRTWATHKGPEHRTITMFNIHPMMPVPMTVYDLMTTTGEKCLWVQTSNNNGWGRSVSSSLNFFTKWRKQWSQLDANQVMRTYEIWAVAS